MQANYQDILDQFHADNYCIQLEKSLKLFLFNAASLIKHI